MKKILLITLFVIFTLSGCDEKMNNFEKKLETLISSHTAESELTNATDLNDFSGDQKISYGLEIVTQTGSESVPVGDLENYMDRELEVFISVGGGEDKKAWRPIDNKNIFILLRE